IRTAGWSRCRTKSWSNVSRSRARAELSAPSRRRPRRRLTVTPGGIGTLACAPDGGWLASTGHLERPVGLWDLEGGRGDRLVASHSHARDAVAFSPDGRLLATAGSDGIVGLWSVTTGAELGQVGGPAERLTAVAFSPDGRMLAASGHD